MHPQVTGFGPFLNHQDNPSGLIASALGGKVLEVSYEAVDSFMHDCSASCFLCLGLHGKASKPRLEVRAWNKVNREKPDVHGLIPKKDAIEEHGEDQATQIDVPELYAYLLGQGFPCSITDDPGTYLCNYIYYKALRKAEGKALLVHLPPIGEEWSKQRLTAFVQAILGWMDEQE